MPLAVANSRYLSQVATGTFVPTVRRRLASVSLSDFLLSSVLCMEYTMRSNFLIAVRRGICGTEKATTAEAIALRSSDGNPLTKGAIFSSFEPIFYHFHPFFHLILSVCTPARKQHDTLQDRFFFGAAVQNALGQFLDKFQALQDRKGYLDKVFSFSHAGGLLSYIRGQGPRPAPWSLTFRVHGRGSNAAASWAASCRKNRTFVRFCQPLSVVPGVSISCMVEALEVW